MGREFAHAGGKKFEDNMTILKGIKFISNKEIFHENFKKWSFLRSEKKYLKISIHTSRYHTNIFVNKSTYK